MGKKRYYDEKGNELRSRPSQSFYQKWWRQLFVLTSIGILLFVGFNILNREDSTTAEPVGSELNNAEKEMLTPTNEKLEVTEEVIDEEIEEQEVIRDVNKEPLFTYEDFKGTYVLFEGIPYESEIEHVVFLEDDSLRDAPMKDAAMNIGFFSRNIVDRKVEGNVLNLAWMHTSEASSGTLKIVLEYHENLENIRFIEGDNSMSEPFYSISHQDLIDNYDTYEIDYARIIMMTGIPRLDPVEPIIEVHQIKSGNAVFSVAESPVYPEDVTRLRSASNSFSNHDVYSIVYSVQGDRYITIYPQPSNFEIDIQPQSDEDYYKLADEILANIKTIYVDSSEPYLVADFISKVKFYYH